MSELKPCAFCGGKAIGAPSCRPEWVYEIKCTDCGAKIKKLAICPSCARREAIEAWNARYERTVTLKDNGHCPDCNRLVGEGERYCAYCGARVKEG